MSVFLGFDRSEYPGDSVMKALRTQAQVAWTGFYLAPAPTHKNTGWMLKRSFLAGLGFGFAPIYVGQQQSAPGSQILTTTQGELDGAAGEASRLPGTFSLVPGHRDRPAGEAGILRLLQGMGGGSDRQGLFAGRLLLTQAGGSIHRSRQPSRSLGISTQVFDASDLRAAVTNTEPVTIQFQRREGVAVCPERQTDAERHYLEAH